MDIRALASTEEQRLLADSVEQFTRRRLGATNTRPREDDPGRHKSDLWREIAELGWLGLSLAEEHGGLGAGALETAIVTEGMGRTLMREPYIQTVVACGTLISKLGAPDQHQEFLPKIAAGQITCTLAHSEPHQPFLTADVKTSGVPHGPRWRLNGTKDCVIGANSADFLLVSASISNRSSGRPGLGIFIVPAQQRGVTLTSYMTIDGGHASDVVFEDVEIAEDCLLGRSDDAGAALICALDHACAALSAEAVGCMQGLLDRTVAYTKTRQQFGRPLSDNQVLRHRMADMAVSCEESRALALRAALSMNSAPNQRTSAASAAKYKIAVAGRFVAEQAVQLHGAMGVMDELDVGLYFKRLLAIETMFGTAAEHLSRFSSLTLEAGIGR